MAQVVNNKPLADLLSVAALKRRGWTSVLIARLLGEPDDVRDNPHFPSRGKMRLYLESRVKRAERDSARLTGCKT